MQRWRIAASVPPSLATALGVRPRGKRCGYADSAALAADMLGRKQIAALPEPEDAAFAPARGPRRDAIRAAHAAVAPLFWGPRIPLDEACATIRAWAAEAFR